MNIRAWLTDLSKGDNLRLFWKFFRLRNRCPSGMRRRILTFFLNRMAHRHGGYVGNGAQFASEPVLPHGLHGVFISRYAKIGRDCWIYQNVTVGEVRRKAPEIGDRCILGAGAVIVGDIRIGDDVKIGAGAVVAQDIPSGTTVVAPPPRWIRKEEHADAKSRMD